MWGRGTACRRVVKDTCPGIMMCIFGEGGKSYSL